MVATHTSSRSRIAATTFALAVVIHSVAAVDNDATVMPRGSAADEADLLVSLVSSKQRQLQETVTVCNAEGSAARAAVQSMVDHVSTSGSSGGSIFAPSDCSNLCAKETALKSCINDECNKGTQPASGSWQKDCASEQSAMNQIYGDLGGLDPSLAGVTGCAGSCDMKCEDIGDWCEPLKPLVTW